MKITYAVMPAGDPVRFSDSAGDASAIARRAVKITLKKLKRWCARLRRGTVAHVVVGEKDRRNCPSETKISCNHGMTVVTPTMIVDLEESRNHANENLENELRESLVNNNRSEMHGAFGDNDDDDDDRGCQSDD